MCHDRHDVFTAPYHTFSWLLWAQSSKPQWNKRFRMILHQGKMVASLIDIITVISTSKEDRIKRVS